MLRKITKLQWGLVLTNILLASATYFIQSYEDMVPVTIGIVFFYILLIINLLIEAIETRVLGKLLLIACTFIYFHMEALGSATSEIRYANNLKTGLFDFSQYSLLEVKIAYIYISLFQLMLFVGYSVQPKMKKIIAFAVSRSDCRPSALWSVRHIAAACGFVIPIMLFGYNIGGIIDGSASFYQGVDLGIQDPGVLNNFTYFGAVGVSLIIAEAVLFSAGTRVRYATIAWGGVVIFPLLLSGVRHLLLYAILPTVVSYLKINENISVKKLFRWVGLVLLVVTAFQVQLVVRSKGLDKIDEIELSSFFSANVSGQFEALLIAIKLVPAEHDYFYEVAEPYFVIHLIPRKLWPEKPTLESWQYYNDAVINGFSGTWTPSIIGQFHLNWSVFGVLFIGMWLGFLTFVLDKMTMFVNVKEQRAMAVFIGNSYAFIVASFRLYAPYYFMFVVFSFLLMIILTQSKVDNKLIPHYSRS